MKKLLFIGILILMAFNCFSQDTLIYKNKIILGTIRKIENGFIYFYDPNIQDIRKIPLNTVTHYGYYKAPMSIEEFSKKPFKTGLDSINYKIAYMQYNLCKFHNEMMTGFIFEGIGLIVGFAGPQLISPPSYINATTHSNDLKTYQNTQFVIAVSGAALSFIGTIICIDSYEWLKRASLEPTLNGASLKVNF
jgi:hypothetical protein